MPIFALTPMTVTRIFKLGIRFAAWVTPQVKEWQRKRNLNLTESERHLKARNWADAEQHLVLALAERRHTSKRRLDLLLQLVSAQCHQGNSAQAEQTLQMAIGLAAQSKDQSMRSRALASLVDIQLDQKKYSEAEQTIREIEALEGAQRSPDRARLALCSSKLGTALLNSGRKSEAFQAFQQAASLSEQAFGPNHEQTAHSLADFGHAGPPARRTCRGTKMSSKGARYSPSVLRIGLERIHPGPLSFGCVTRRVGRSRRRCG
jgi:tetratricopeptide (TPR) repeat protein